MNLEKINDVPVMVYDADGATISTVPDALDLIGDAGYQGARWAAVPAERFGEDFFQLRTRIAGEIVQKFVQYGMGLAIVGDITRHVEASDALRDFVRECNRGRQTWFVADLAELGEKLG